MERTRRTPQRTRRQNLVDQVEHNSTEPVAGKSMIDTSVLIPSGLTLLNCAASDNPFGAFALGQIVTVPGASQGGKTILMLNMLAAICQDSRFDEYDLIYDDSEETVDRFDIPYLFGKVVQERMMPPDWDDDFPLYSNTIQDLKENLLGRITESKPFIYILDSLDTLTTGEELEREYKRLLAKATDDEAVKALKGSYKTEKAKACTELLRMVNGRLKATKSALFIVQQIRSKIGASKFEKQWTTSGGKAPFFYSVHQIYMSKVKTHNPKIGSMKLKIGSRSRLEFIKNKLTGKERTVEIDVFTDFGMDDIGSCIDYLTDTKTWKKKGGYITPGGVYGDQSYLKKDLRHKIHNDDLMESVQIAVGKAWLEVEATFRPDMPRRFE